MQHMPAGSGYRSVTSDLIQHPQFTDGETEEQRREGLWEPPNQSGSKAFHPGMLGIFPTKTEHPRKVCCCGRRGSRGQRSVESFASGQAGWAEMPQQVVRASKSPGVLSVCVCLARDQAPSQLGLDRTH